MQQDGILLKDDFKQKKNGLSNDIDQKGGWVSCRNHYFWSLFSTQKLFSNWKFFSTQKKFVTQKIFSTQIFFLFASNATEWVLMLQIKKRARRTDASVTSSLLELLIAAKNERLCCLKKWCWKNEGEEWETWVTSSLPELLIAAKNFMEHFIKGATVAKFSK